jgi:hypothetical protein
MKTFRLYYNRANDAPQIWSIDEGSHASEINVRDIIIRVPCSSAANLEAEYPEPKAWFIATGNLTFIQRHRHHS